MKFHQKVQFCEMFHYFNSRFKHLTEEKYLINYNALKRYTTQQQFRNIFNILLVNIYVGRLPVNKKIYI